ncbi:MAG: hypothetical protein RL151_1288 [Bacteroidota bacterium]|jgi:hypothetical protein
MKQFLTASLLLTLMTPAFSQTTESPADQGKRDWKKADLSNRSSDHLMFQFGYTGWSGAPDSIQTGGFSRSFNTYFLFDFPFKSDPRLSVGVGVGVGTDNMFFTQTAIDLKNTEQIKFRRDSVTQYKRYKLGSAYFEAPLELRWAKDPEHMNKSLKFAVGLKMGLPIDLHAKAKVTRDAAGNVAYTYKEKDRKFANNFRAVATARVGFGNFSLFGTYALTGMFREGQGPTVRPYTVGLCLSGL